MISKISSTKKGETSILELFSEPFITRFPDVKSYEFLEKVGAIFVLVPEYDFCQKASVLQSGVPPYLVKFKVFSEGGKEAIKSLVSKNPFFKMEEEFSGTTLSYETFTFSIVNDLNYSQVIDLVEAYCSLLNNQKSLIVKRFKMNVDFERTRKMSFTALDQGETFESLLVNYRGQADLYDKSFTQYAWELMQEKGLL
jgi:hypothetical protein